MIMSRSTSVSFVIGESRIYLNADGEQPVKRQRVVEDTEMSEVITEEERSRRWERIGSKS